VSLERGPLRILSAIEELFEIKSKSPRLEIREYGRWDPSRLPRGILHPQKLALTSLTSDSLSLGIVR
jgi:hypothetical protein